MAKRFDYSKLAGTGKRLVDRFGYDASIVRTVDDVVTTFAVVIVMTEYRPQDRDGVLIQQTDRKAIMSAVGLTFTPDPQTDRLVAGGESLQLVTVTPTSPAGVAIIYELQVRR